MLRCHFIRRTGGRGLKYEVLFTSDLGASLEYATPGDSTWVTPLTNDWEQVTVQDYSFSFSNGPGKRFGRVRVSLDR